MNPPNYPNPMAELAAHAIVERPTTEGFDLPHSASLGRRPNVARLDDLLPNARLVEDQRAWDKLVAEGNLEKAPAGARALAVQFPRHSDGLLDKLTRTPPEARTPWTDYADELRARWRMAGRVADALTLEELAVALTTDRRDAVVEKLVDRFGPLASIQRSISKGQLRGFELRQALARLDQARADGVLPGRKSKRRAKGKGKRKGGK
jgi:hypothetical protein